ncbi:NADH dehydrogenase,E; NADH dehydrogenase [Phycisphaerales bacterium]|nr:NADH dehydrogenase,E; NADH dehydrogenase [Phycisphaerales bacterium]
MNTITTVAVTGATGFVGRYVVRELVAAGYQVRALVRDRAKARTLLPSARVTVIQGDALDRPRVDEMLNAAQACINLLGIIREAPNGQTFERVHTRATRLLVERCEALSVRRFVQMSALNVRDVASCEYQRTKWEAEKAVRTSSLDWTILRPSLIHGPEGEFVHLAKRWAGGHHAPWLFIPYFSREVEDKRVPLGAVSFADPMVQPIDVRDAAKAFAACLPNETTFGEVYNLVGSEALSFPDMLRHIRDHVHGANRDLEPHGIPGHAAGLAAKAAGMMGLGSLLPFDEGMAVMGTEDATANLEKVKADLGLNPRPFRAAFAEYAASV